VYAGEPTSTEEDWVGGQVLELDRCKGDRNVYLFSDGSETK